MKTVVIYLLIFVSLSELPTSVHSKKCTKTILYRCDYDKKTFRPNCTSGRSNVENLKYSCELIFTSILPIEPPVDSKIEFSEKYPNLRTLDISHNGISGIDGDNTFGTKKASLGQGGRHAMITKLIASHNRFDRIPIVIYGNMPKLEEIDFSYNEIQGLNFGDFNDTTKLRVINCSYNQIKTIENITFSKLSQLELLDLNNNLIGSLASNTFEKNPKLKWLNLRNNPLKHFDLNRFFDFNTIFDFKILFKSSKSCVMNLERNKFDQLDEGTPDDFPGLKHVRISGNLFHFVDLKDFLKKWATNNNSTNKDDKVNAIDASTHGYQDGLGCCYLKIVIIAATLVIVLCVFAVLTFWYVHHRRSCIGQSQAVESIYDEPIDNTRDSVIFPYEITEPLNLNRSTRVLREDEDEQTYEEMYETQEQSELNINEVLLLSFGMNNLYRLSRLSSSNHSNHTNRLNHPMRLNRSNHLDYSNRSNHLNHQNNSNHQNRSNRSNILRNKYAQSRRNQPYDHLQFPVE